MAGTLVESRSKAFSLAVDVICSNLTSATVVTLPETSNVIISSEVANVASAAYCRIQLYLERKWRPSAEPNSCSFHFDHPYVYPSGQYNLRFFNYDFFECRGSGYPQRAGCCP